jgi:hypothetical protein
MHLHPLRGTSIADANRKIKEGVVKIPYIQFTDDQKRRAGEVDLEQFLLRQGERLIPSGFEKRLASDHSITIRGNRWYDHAAEQGGGPVSFVRQFYNLSYPEAVTCLLGGEQGTVYASAPKQEKKEKLRICPRLPRGWDRLDYTVNWRGQKLYVAVTKKHISIQNLTGTASVEIEVNGEACIMERNDPLLFIKVQE